MEIARAVKAAGKVGTRSGFARMVVYLTPEQIGAVVAEAQERANKAGRIRADASEVVREAVERWREKRR